MHITRNAVNISPYMTKTLKVAKKIKITWQR